MSARKAVIEEGKMTRDERGKEKVKVKIWVYFQIKHRSELHNRDKEKGIEGILQS